MTRLVQFTTGCVAIVVCTVCTTASAQVTAGSSTDWLTGKALEKSRVLPTSVSWTQSAWRDHLEQLSSQSRRAIFIDRRIDPTQEFSLQITEASTDRIVWLTAKSNGAGVAQVGDLLYFGPKKHAARLPFAIVETKKRIRKFPKQARSKWNRKSEISWREATSTGEIQSWFEKTHGLKFDRPFPHDVWAKGDWPKLTLTEQLSLALVGFDMGFEVGSDGNSIKLTPFPDIESASRKFKLSMNGFDFKQAKQTFPGLKLSKSGATATAKGSVDAIAALEEWIFERQKVTVGENDTRTFTLKYENTRRGDILISAADKTGRKLALEGNAGTLLLDQISLDLKNVSLEQLIEKCLEGTGLKYRLSNSTLTISDK